MTMTNRRASVSNPLRAARSASQKAFIQALLDHDRGFDPSEVGSALGFISESGFGGPNPVCVADAPGRMLERLTLLGWLIVERPLGNAGGRRQVLIPAATWDLHQDIEPLELWGHGGVALGLTSRVAWHVFTNATGAFGYRWKRDKLSLGQRLERNRVKPPPYLEYLALGPEPLRVLDDLIAVRNPNTPLETQVLAQMAAAAVAATT